MGKTVATNKGPLKNIGSNTLPEPTKGMNSTMSLVCVLQQFKTG